MEKQVTIDASTEVQHEALSTALEADERNTRELLEIMDGRDLAHFQKVLQALLALVQDEVSTR